MALVIFMASCNSEDEEPVVNVSWKSLGLDNHIINHIYPKNNIAYVTTDRGFFKGDYTEEEPTWQLLGFTGEVVQSAIIMDENYMVVSVVDRQNPQQPSLYKTTNGGADWTAFQNGFGGDEAEPVLDLTKDPTNSDTWYGTGFGVVAKSEDAGQSWNPVYGDWHGFGSGISVVRVRNNNPQQVWAGGQNAIEQGFLIKTSDAGNNWTDMNNLLPPPAVAKEIVFHPTETQTVFAGFEGGLIKTINNGNSWTTLIDTEESKKFFFGIAIDHDRPSVVYAGGWLKRFDEPQPFIIYRSTNGGRNWRTYENEEVDFGGIHHMVWAGSGQNKKLLVGLFKGGIYEVKFE